MKVCDLCGTSELNGKGKCRCCSKQKKLARKKEWTLANKERINTRANERRTEQRWLGRERPKLKTEAEKKAARKKYIAQNADKIRAQKAVAQMNRKNKLRSSGTLSSGVVDRLYAEQNGLCACCDIRLHAGYHLDHKIPIARGGSNTDDNVQLLSPTCNLLKGMLTPEEYSEKKKRKKESKDLGWRGIEQYIGINMC